MPMLPAWTGRLPAPPRLVLGDRRASDGASSPKVGRNASLPKLQGRRNKHHCGRAAR
jgi:hypothetical protein